MQVQRPFMSSRHPDAKVLIVSLLEGFDDRGSKGVVGLRQVEV